MKGEKATIKELYTVSKNTGIFDNNTSMKLSNFLYIKIMDQKEKIRDWICKECQFVNCKLMLDGIWVYYNRGNDCGLCGESLNVNYVDRSNVKNTIEEPNIDTEKWKKINALKCCAFITNLLSTF
eukprot:269188_1